MRHVQGPISAMVVRAAATAVAAVLVGVTLLVSTTPAHAATGSPGGSSNAATLGSAPLIPADAHEEGATPLDQDLSFDVVVKPRDQAALDSFVQQVSTPGSASYRHFLAPGEYEAAFGPTPQAMASVKAGLAKLGLKVVAANGSVVSVSGSVAQVRSALHTGFTQYRLASGRLARANTSAPQLPVTIAPLVQGVVGLDTLMQFKTPSPAVKLARSIGHSATPRYTGAGCLAPGSFYYTADQLATYYGLTPFYSANHLGDGVTVAIFELESYSASDIAEYQTCYNTAASVTPVAVDGTNPNADAGSGESALDIEDVIGLAPQAKIRVYDSVNSGSGILDEWTQIVADDAQVVSTSWGECEQPGEEQFFASERQLFQQMAAQGQTVLAASGDNGSEDCYSSSSALAVDDPASQPEVTGVGGTDLTSLSGPETTWNEGVGGGAGGGGISRVWAMPAWQKVAGVVSGSSGTPCGAAGNYCREVPDVSASADPAHGYAIYFNGGWYDIGGTSAAAPTWASLVALIDSSCTGQRLGLMNPALYQLEAAGGTAFNDVTVGNNDMTASNASDFTATPAYDMASGLGTPIGSALGTGLCPGLAADGAGTMTVDHSEVEVGSTTTLTFTYTAPPGQALTDGELTVTVPASWPVPSTTGTEAGYATASAGVVSVSGSTIQVVGVTTAGGATVTVTYGDRSAGGPGVMAPALPEDSSFTAAMKASSTGVVTSLAASPAVHVWTTGADGSGSLTATPNTASSGVNTTITFSYTPSAGTGIDHGEVTVAVPAGWSPPSTSGSAAGYVTASTGTVTVSGSTIQVSSVTIDPATTLTIIYGATSGGGPGAKATGLPSSTFAAMDKTTAAGTLTGLSASPDVTVSADGSGSMMVSPTSVLPGAVTTLTFTYTVATGIALANGELDLTVPTGWPAPSTIPTDPGYVTATAGSAPTVAGSVIQVAGLDLSAGSVVRIVYGDTSGTGPGVTAPATEQSFAFATKQKATVSGTLTSLAASPTVTVSAPPPPSGGGGGGGGGHPQLLRVSGADRIATSIAASQAAFPKANSARVVVLARSDSFADALAGTPLAARNNGPLLLTLTAQLQDTTIGEIGRILPIGSTIYLLGGTSAISTGIETQLSGFGYVVQRLAGPDRFATAVKIADALGDPTTVFEADGTNFPDALSAGGAAAQQGAAILLTAGSTMSSASAAYLTAHPSVRYAVGGPAAKADPGAQPLVGADRYATSVLVAETFFPSPISVGLASGLAFPDALSGGVVAALDNGPMMLVPSAGGVPASTISYLTNAGNTASAAWLFGGTGSVSDDVFTQAANALKPPSA